MFDKRPPAVGKGVGGNEMDSQSRRLFLRANVAIEAVYSAQGRDGERKGTIQTLGGGGLRFATDEDLATSTMMTLHFKLPSGADVTAKGRVVLSFFDARDKRFSPGVAFTQIDAGHQSEIVAIISKLIEN